MNKFLAYFTGLMYFACILSAKAGLILVIDASPSVFLGGDDWKTTFTFTVTNPTQDDFNNIQIVDELSLTFSAPTTYGPVFAPGVTTSALFTANGSYTGSSPNNQLLSGLDSLLTGESAWATFTVGYKLNGNLNTPFFNTAVLKADGMRDYSDTIQFHPVPLPGTVWLFCGGMATLLSFRKCKE